PAPPRHHTHSATKPTAALNSSHVGAGTNRNALSSLSSLLTSLSRYPYHQCLDNCHRSTSAEWRNSSRKIHHARKPSPRETHQSGHPWPIYVFHFILAANDSSLGGWLSFTPHS